MSGCGTMPIFSRLMFHAVHWASRKGLREDAPASSVDKKAEARQTGIRGETYAYWFLRRHGYVFIARNYTPPGAKGEIDLIGYDGKTLAFVEVRTRTVRPDQKGLPEMSVTGEKRRHLVKTAQRFLAASRTGECPLRFDVFAIDNCPGRPPIVRLHKDAFSPQA
jgi:putative endonuclease